MKATERILIPLAEGFEEIEAITIIDTLRRAGLDVVTAGVKSASVVGAHGIEVKADRTLDQLEQESFAMIVLPGGMPGTSNLAEDARVLRLVRSMRAQDKYVTAICAAPTVLAKAGVISGVPVTCYPGFETKLGDARFEQGKRVVKSGKVITSRGPGTALEFALALVEELHGATKAGELREAMIARV